MTIGVVSRSFPEMTNAQCAQFMKEYGFGPTELCLTATDSKYWAYNGRSVISDMTDERFAQIVQAYNVDGGASAELVFDGQSCSPLTPSGERGLYDIIYFATTAGEGAE